MTANARGFNTVNTRKIWSLDIIAVVILKLKLCGFDMQKVQKFYQLAWAKYRHSKKQNI